MNSTGRRSFLAGALATGLAGCPGLASSVEPSTPDGIDVDTLYIESDVFGEHPDERDEEYYTIITEADTANDELHGDESLDSFVDATNFDTSYLVIVQADELRGPAELKLESVNRLDTGLALDVQFSDEETAFLVEWRHSLLIRITDQEAGVPETLDVEISGYR